MPKTAEKTHETAGAGAALAWIASKEAEGRLRVDELEKALANAMAVRDLVTEGSEGENEHSEKVVKRAKIDLEDAVKAHDVRLKQLREYDRSVSDDKRTAVETITREDGSKLVQSLVIYVRQAHERIKEVADKVRACESDQDAYALIERAIGSEVSSAIKLAVREGHLPKWVSEAADSVI